MLRRLLFLCTSATAVLCGVTPADAQSHRGQLRTAEGRGLPDGIIGLWRGTGEFYHVQADADGRFALPADSVARASSMTARAIGFIPRTLRVPAHASDSLVIILERYAQPLPDLVVADARQTCPNRDDPEARALWNATRSKYDLVPLDRAYRSTQRWYRAEVEVGAVGHIVEDQLTAGWEGRRGDYRLLAHERIRESGYALRRTPAGGEGVDTYLNWWYPRLDRWDADQWLRDAFGQRNALSILERAADGVTLAFCGRRGPQPSIEGLLKIGVDSTLLMARWQFVTPKPNENAGGEVAFVPTGRRLLPLRSIFWRRSGADRALYFQDAALHEGWSFGPTVEIPPRR
jgi:hypothetical protein